MAEPNAPHEPDVTTLRAAVAATARMLVRAGLIEAFGHVSARCADGMVLTTVRPLARAGVDDTVVLDASGRVLDGPADVVPLEASMHLAVYRARSDVGAICRGHPSRVRRHTNGCGNPSIRRCPLKGFGRGP